jgi:ribonucleotide reductase alpha subunit
MSNGRLSDNAIEVANSRYFREGEDWEACTNRVGRVVAAAENSRMYKYVDKFSEMIYNLDFLPGGRILRNAGRQRGSLYNCYVLPIGDSREEIGQFYKDSLIVWGEGGGIGVNISSLRPNGAQIKGVGGVSSGPVSFLVASDAIAETIESGGSRRAAALALMHVTHPDVMKFIDAKLIDGKLPHYNISVGITNEFLEAVELDTDWEFKFAQQSYGKIGARKIWDKIMCNMIENAEPGVINLNNLFKNNSYYFEPVQCVNPCGEVPLGPYSCCNLGSLVLPSFITGAINTNWKKMEDTIELAVRFLDDVIDTNKYVLQELDINAHNSRRIGIGIMGLAEYLFAKKLRYGSEKSIYEIERLMRFIRDKVYESSIKLAKEKGAFPKFDPIAYGKASFIRKLPAQLRMDIKEHGIRNTTLQAVAPTGCLVGETIVPSNKGCRMISDYEGIKTTHPIKLSSDFGISHFKKFFDQGFADTIKIITKKGYSLEGTHDHKIRVVTDGNGYIWKKLEDITSNDYVVLKKNFLFEKETWLRNEVAELLGFYMADGWWTTNGEFSRRLYFKINKSEEKYIVDLLNKCFDNTFRINPIIRDAQGNSKLIEVNSKKLYNWFEKYGCIKNGANNAFIPDVIMQGSKGSVLSFIRGFLLGDGDFNTCRESIRFTTTSERMASQLQILLLGVGCVSSRYVEPTKGNVSVIEDRTITSNYDAHRIYLSTYYSRVLCELIGYDSSVIDNKYDGRNFENALVLPYEEKFFGQIYKIDDREIYYVTEYLYSKNIDNKNWFIDSNLVMDRVGSIIEYSNKHVYDIEVNEVTHTYVANGFVTHNTISLIADATSGIEPLFRKAYLRHDRVSDRMYIHPIYRNILSTGGKISEWYVDTDDLKPADHFETQSVVQKYTDGAVSKTINMPKGTTAKQLSRLTLEYINDLKGVTVYVDETREGQILNKVTRKEADQYLKDNKVKESADEESVQCASGNCEV